MSVKRVHSVRQLPHEYIEDAHQRLIEYASWDTDLLFYCHPIGGTHTKVVSVYSHAHRRVTITLIDGVTKAELDSRKYDYYPSDFLSKRLLTFIGPN